MAQVAALVCLGCAECGNLKHATTHVMRERYTTTPAVSKRRQLVPVHLELPQLLPFALHGLTHAPHHTSHLLPLQLQSDIPRKGLGPFQATALLEQGGMPAGRVASSGKRQ
jgi:hypothetical protein